MYTYMLPVIGKLFENNISKQLINYINDNNLFGIFIKVHTRN